MEGRKPVMSGECAIRGRVGKGVEEAIHQGSGRSDQVVLLPKARQAQAGFERRGSRWPKEVGR